jgi:hypothetical protein
VALNALLALEPVEAAYPSAETDTRGDALTGARRYRLHIPIGGIPVDAFWSLSMYELIDDDRLFFADNPIKRYAIGDRTGGLKKNADGSIDILIQRILPVARVNRTGCLRPRDSSRWCYVAIRLRLR